MAEPIYLISREDVAEIDRLRSARMVWFMIRQLSLGLIFGPLPGAFLGSGHPWLFGVSALSACICLWAHLRIRRVKTQHEALFQRIRQTRRPA